MIHEMRARTCTSKVALKPIRRWPSSSLSNKRWKLCLKIAVANESEITITPFVKFASDFISNKPTWSRQPANKSMACPFSADRFAKAS